MVIAGLEQRLLKISIVTTAAVAVIGVFFGLYAGSESIVFDGLFDAVDASMSLLSLLVSKLLASEVSRRFQQGYWHMEPMVLALNGSVLVFLCIYAFINSVKSFLAGGNVLEFDSAALYSLVISVFAFAMYFYEKVSNRTVKSELVKLDIQSWLMSGAISASLLSAFIVGLVIEGSEYAWMARYIDPLVLAILSICLVPIPLLTVVNAVKQILMITPTALDAEISEVLSRMGARYRFERFTHYVTQVGRGFFVEIHIVLPIEMNEWRVSDLDQLRRVISDEIGREGPDRWLSIGFTRDARWL